VADLFRSGSRAAAIELLLGDEDVPIDLGSLDDYDTVSIDIELDGKNRRVILGRDRYPQIGYPVDGIDVDDEGYPDMNSLARAAAELAQEIGGPIGLA
jgi:hypothetical protein